MYSKIHKKTVLFLLIVIIFIFGIRKVREIATRDWCKEESLQDVKTVKSSEYKTILLWKDWFGGKWESGFGPVTTPGLKNINCPSWQCTFTKDVKKIDGADAVVFAHAGYKSLYKHHYHRCPNQRWIVVNQEPPGGARGMMKYQMASHLVNWTMHYHTASDVKGGFYGHFEPLEKSKLPFQSNLMEEHPKALANLRNALVKDMTLEDVLGDTWKSYVNRTKAVAWMVSNCKALSRRQDYVEELKKYIHIDIYGRCTNKPCLDKTTTRRQCWENFLRWEYSFYLSFENSICDEYISEKLYMPMVYGVIPVVYGGADYSKFLPPNSYINARDYHPKELAQKLKELHENPVALGRYHLWRGYLRADPHGSFCHLCHLLHTDTSHKQQKDINSWYHKQGNCKNPIWPLFNNEKYPNACKDYINTNLSCLSSNKSSAVP